MSEISSASDEQSRGIDQVALAVSEMDQVTQQNASLVEESAAAAAALEDQAARLNQAVSVFKVSRPRGALAFLAGAKSPAVVSDSSAGDGEWEKF